MKDTPGRHPDLMTVEETAEYLDRSVRWVYAAAANGTLPAAHIARAWTFSRRRIDAWIEAQFDVA